MPDGRVEYTYCHMMGYPYWNGRILERSWTRPEDIAQLTRASHMSSLPYTPEELRRETELYMIHEEEKPLMVEEGIEEFLTHALDRFDIEWAYLFNGREWLCAKTRGRSGEITPLGPVRDMIRAHPGEGPVLPESPAEANGEGRVMPWGPAAPG